VSRDNLPGVLRAHAPLQRRLDEVPDLTQHAQQNTNHDGVAETQARKQPAACGQRREQRRGELSHGSLDRLAGADAGSEFVAPHERAHGVGRRLPEPSDPDEEQNPVNTVRQRPQRDGVAKQPVDVADAEERDRHALPAHRPRRAPIETRGEEPNDHHRKGGAGTVGAHEGERNETAPDEPRVPQDRNACALEHARELPVREHADADDQDGEEPGGRADQDPDEGGQEDDGAENAPCELAHARRTLRVDRCRKRHAAGL